MIRFNHWERETWKYIIYGVFHPQECVKDRITDCGPEKKLALNIVGDRFEL